MIVVFGGLNIDLVFPVARLPCPGETVLGQSYQIVAGGKGANQAVAASRAGAATRMVGAAGNDPFGARVTEELAAAGVDVTGVIRVDRPTGCAVIGVDDAAENQIMVASGANLEARANQAPDEWLTPDTTVLLQLEVNLDENWHLLRRAKAHGARTVLNAAPAQAIPSEVLGLLDILIMNEHESEEMAGCAGFQAGEAVERARFFANTYSLHCIVTLGSRGAVAAEPAGAWRIGALAVDPIDTTAAGDGFVGALTAALDQGLAMPEALRRGSIAGALACTVAGAMPSLPDRKAVEARLSDLQGPIEICR